MPAEEEKSTGKDQENEDQEQENKEGENETETEMETEKMTIAILKNVLSNANVKDTKALFKSNPNIYVLKRPFYRTTVS